MSWRKRFTQKSYLIEQSLGAAKVSTLGIKSTQSFREAYADNSESSSELAAVLSIESFLLITVTSPEKKPSYNYTAFYAILVSYQIHPDLT